MALCLCSLLALACASAAGADVEAGQRCPSFRTPVTALSDEGSLVQMTRSLSGAEGISSEKDMVADRHGPPAKTTESREQEPSAESDAPEANNLTVFFNIYQRDAELTRKIVDEQIQSLQKHFDVIDQVLYVTIDGTPELTYECDKCQKYAHYSQGDEDVTLQLLFEHCAAGKSAKVAYIHSKGSFHSQDGRNNALRRFLMGGALSESCLQMPSQCNICGSRWSPFPHQHIPGNMWVARCDYVRELIPPNRFTTAMNELLASPASGSFKWITADRRNWRCGTDRFAMEHWALSHPHVLPCDVYRGGYHWGYNGIPTDWTPSLLDASQVQMAGFIESVGWGYYRKRKQFILSDVWSWRVHEWMQLYHAIPEPGTWAWKLYSQ